MSKSTVTCLVLIGLLAAFLIITPRQTYANTCDEEAKRLANLADAIKFVYEDDPRAQSSMLEVFIDDWLEWYYNTGGNSSGNSDNP